jgi:hypothetical protein
MTQKTSRTKLKQQRYYYAFLVHINISTAVIYNNIVIIIFIIYIIIIIILIINIIIIIIMIIIITIIFFEHVLKIRRIITVLVWFG